MIYTSGAFFDTIKVFLIEKGLGDALSVLTVLSIFFLLSENFLYFHLINSFLCFESIRKSFSLDLLVQRFD